MVKDMPVSAGEYETCVRSLGGEEPQERTWQPTPVFLPGESHGQKSLAGYGPWDHKELDTAEHISTHIHSGNKRYS